MEILFKKIIKTAEAPILGKYKGDAGIDFFAARSLRIAGRTVKPVSTGIAIAIPEGYYGQFFDRGGFGSQTTLSVKCGVIDSGFRGEVKIIFANTSDYPVHIDVNTKIAQLVILPVPEVELKEVNELPDAERAERAFGSSDDTEEDLTIENE